jgi:hypothetical protein
MAPSQLITQWEFITLGDEFLKTFFFDIKLFVDTGLIIRMDSTVKDCG